MSEIRIIPAGGGETIDFRGARITRKVPAAATGDRWAFGEATQPPGFDNPIHTHDGEAEAFYVLGGTIAFHGEGGSHEAQAGTLVFIPAGTPHGFTAGADGSRLLCLWPAAFDGYFEEMNTASRDGLLDPQTITAIGLRHDVHAIAPRPRG